LATSHATHDVKADLSNVQAARNLGEILDIMLVASNGNTRYPNRDA
jgi:hypothetical protein